MNSQMIIDARLLDRDLRLETEVCIIGSGAGGAVIAKELAEQGRKVVLLEEGEHHPTEHFTRNGTEMVRTLYRDCGMTGTLGKPVILLPQGKCVGGTTTINSGTCLRTPDAILTKWRGEGLTELTPEHLNPFAEKVETFLGVKEPPRELLGKHNLIIMDTAQRLGLSTGILKRNAPGCQGSGVCCFGCPTGGKHSMVVSYIPRAVSLGAQVYTRTRAEKLLIRNQRVVGVIGKIRGGSHERTIEVRASIVIVAGGSIQSPLFLERNRIARNSKVLGKNLSIHPATRVMALFEEKVETWRGVPQGTYIDEFADDGILLEGTALPPSLSSTSIHLIGKEFSNIMAQFPNIASYGIMVSDEARGSVRHIGGLPVVFYQLTDRDVSRLIKGIEILSEIYFAAGAKQVFLPVPILPVLNSPEETSRIRQARMKGKNFELFAFHPMGTCRMGVDEKNSVVNANLETHDVERLFVCDASVIPTSLGVNPQMTIMTLATRLGDYLRKESEKYF